MTKLPEKKYLDILSNLKDRIRQARLKAALTVNAQLLSIYWEIGKTILEQQNTEGWGAKIIDRLSIDLKTEFTDMKGFSVRNLKYMRAFAEAYPDFTIVQGQLAQIRTSVKNPIVQVPLAQLTWYHHITLLDKVKDVKERMFYIQKTIENGWSRDIMVLQIESSLYTRQGKAISNFKETLPSLESDLARETFKNPYVFDFLMIGEEAKEREVERALVHHLKKFMLELGKGFAYVGNQFNIVVKDDDYFLDLLFYNYILHRFVIFELKVGDFKPEFAGKLNFYINIVDDKIRGNKDGDTIGILLCKTPNELVVRFSLQGIKAPIGVSEYNLQKALPKELKGGLPSIKELESEIEKEYEELKSPADKKLDLIKQKLAALKNDEIKIRATNKILFEIIDKSLLPLYKELLKKMKVFDNMFFTTSYKWYAKNKVLIENIDQLADTWKNEEYLNDENEFYFSYLFNSCKKAGVEAFSTSFQLNWVIDAYFYGFTLINYNKQQPFLKKLYHEQLSSENIKTIVDTIYEQLVNEIGNRVEQISNK